jgi:para-aminobenzoate synthetase / 4-amino-4-deoxychorismate lyase
MDAFNPAQPFILLENSQGGTSYLFTDMVAAVSATAAADVPAALGRVRAATTGGMFAAGWIGFEAGYALESRFTPTDTADDLLWFGLFQSRRSLTPLEAETLWRAPQATPQSAQITQVTPRWSAADYAARMAKVHDYIVAGDIYQANLTFAADVAFEGTPLALYQHLRRAQRVPFGALIFTGARWILSFSPELFFDLNNGQLTAQPMKGTAARAWPPEADTQAAQALQQDAKNRAENLMIVDLLRNDFSKVSVAGSVQVPALFEIVSYPTVHQMTSTITATLHDTCDAIDVLQALFPCGSVTGAPKLRAMEIIQAQESAPRSVYCGAIGQITPDQNATFNVAIRTLDVLAPGQAIIGLGSGVVADSVAADEYAECLLKAKFLRQTMPDFDLIETMLWQPGHGWQHWQAHIERLQKSARFWAFQLNEVQLIAEAKRLSASWNSAQKVRLLVSRFGTSCWSWSAAPPQPSGAPFIIIAPTRMRSDNVFLYHKTSHRAFYDEERKRLAAQHGCFECLFLNERGEVTEGSFTTLFVRQGKDLRTPALSSGLLPGILRQSLLKSGAAREAILTLADVRQADQLFVGNSVRGLVAVTLHHI